jgi:hypothetical protein
VATHTENENGDPTIAEVLAEFVGEQENRLAPKTFTNYRHVVQLLEHCLNSYASQSLEKTDARRFERLFNAKGSEHREFCQVFGPEHILPNVSEFLGYFMVRKVMAGKDLLRAAGTVTKKLARWLAAKGYAGGDDVEEAAGRGAAAARDLPKAEELATRLHDFAANQERGDQENEVEDHFAITRVEPGKIWLTGMLDGRELGPIALPDEIARFCKVGWTISGAVGRLRKRWLLVEAWNVYPD